MLRMTKMAAAMLVLTCAITAVPQQAEKSVWGALVELMEGPGNGNYEYDLFFHNNTGRTINVTLYDDRGIAGGGTLKPGEQISESLLRN